MKIIGNVSDWLSYAGGALIEVADSAGSTVFGNFLAPKIFSVSFHSHTVFQIKTIHKYAWVLNISEKHTTEPNYNRLKSAAPVILPFINMSTYI